MHVQSGVLMVSGTLTFNSRTSAIFNPLTNNKLRKNASFKKQLNLCKVF